MTEATTDLADAGVADKEELEEVVVLAGVHGEVVEGVEGRCLGELWRKVEVVQWTR